MQDDQTTVDVLVVGQTPPPVHGQAIMIERMLRGPYTRVRLHHARMAFSHTLDEVGSPRPGKLLHLVGLILRIAWMRMRYRPTVLYYPPAGPSRIPLYRDLVVLACTRWMFPHTVFHFHAGGGTRLYPSLSAPLRAVYRLAMFRPAVAIRPYASGTPDGEALQARQNIFVPLGIDDCALPPVPAAPGAGVRLLYVGLLAESKGVSILLDACESLAAQQIPFTLALAGGFESSAFERAVRARLAASSLAGRVTLLGVVQGEDKWRAFARADIFCFPTFYEAESFGVVLLEAMSCGLPIVATRWRAIPDIVVEGETALLVPPRDATALVDALARLAATPAERIRMGHAGRDRYARVFTAEQYIRRLERAFLAASHGMRHEV